MDKRWNDPEEHPSVCAAKPLVMSVELSAGSASFASCQGSPDGRVAKPARKFGTYSAWLAVLLASCVVAASALIGASGGSLSGRPRVDARQRISAGGWSRVPSGLQTAIDRTLSRVAATSPAGLTLRWGSGGTVWLSPAGAGRMRFGLEPQSIGRFRTESLSPRPFVFGAAGASEALGDGLSAWYRDRSSGWEQGFTVRTRPGGAGQSFTISLAYRGDSRLRDDGPNALAVSEGRRVVMTYGGLRATDAKGRVLAAHLALENGGIKLVVRDAGAAYPLTIDPYIAPSTTPAATFAGANGEELAWAVALSDDGQTAAVSAPTATENGVTGCGAVYVYTASGGSWSNTSPRVATLDVPGSGRFGEGVAVSADGQTILVGASSTPGLSSGTVSCTSGPNPSTPADGAAYIFTAPGGDWSSTSTPTATIAGAGDSGEQLGHSVALSADGRTALVSAPYAGPGAVYLYTASGSSWSNTPTPTPAFSFTDTRPGASNGGDDFGERVELSANGQTAMIGAPDSVQDNGSSDGAAYIYTEGGGWSNTPTATFTGHNGELLGVSGALSANGQTALVGASNATENGVEHSGAVYVYTSAGGNWSTTPQPVPTATIAGTGGEELGLRLQLSADGQTALIGAPGFDAGDGAAYIYTAPGGNWSNWSTSPQPQPTDTFTGSTGEQLGFHGLQLSADGQIATVGAPLAVPDNGAYDGAFDVYTAPAGHWSATPVSTFNGTGGEQLGWSVALSGDEQTALVGAPDTTVNGVTDSGTAYIYTASPDGSWSSTPAATLIATGSGIFGHAVALSDDGQTALVGAPFSDCQSGAKDCGAAYLYTAPGGTWSGDPAPTASFTGATAGETLGFSSALSADGQTVLLSAPYSTATNPTAASGTPGAAYVYTASGGSWANTPNPTTPTATFTDTRADAGNDEWGFKVNLSADGHTAVVGVPDATVNGVPDGGAAYIYTASGGTWSTTPAATLTDPGSGGDEFGYAAELSADGQTALLGAPDTMADSGAAYVYTASGGSWSNTPALTGTLTDPTGTGAALFGYRLVLSDDGQTALVGAPDATESGNSDSGAAYIYTASEGSWSSTPTTTFSTGIANEEFGYHGLSLSADAETATVGAPFANGNDGALYIYSKTASQTITFATAAVTYGQQDFSPASSDSGLPVAYSNASGACQIDSQGLVQITAQGTCEVTASQPGSPDYSAATPVTALITVAPATLTLDPQNVTTTYGVIPTFTYAWNGFVNGDDASVVSGVPQCAAPASDTAVGTYTGAITCSIAGLSTSNYTIVAGPPATLQINRARQALLRAPDFWTYGDQGFEPALSSAGLPITYSDASGACQINSQGQLEIIGAGNCELTATQDGNQDYAAATPLTTSISIAPATLTLDPQNETITYGQTPSSTYQWSGFVNGDNASVVTGTPTCSTPSTDVDAGTYPGAVTCSVTGLSAANYTIVAGAAATLQINPAPQTITFPATTVTYGQADFSPASSTSDLTVTYTSPQGQCTTDTAGLVEITGAGTCTITANQSGDRDYSPASPVTQTFTINKAATTLKVATATWTLLAVKLSATLTSQYTDQPVAGQVVRFSFLGQTLCQAFTGPSGVATCTVAPAIIITLGPTTYTATYTTTSNYLGTTGTGTLTKGLHL